MRDVPAWLFVVGVAAFVLGLTMVTAGLVPPENGRHAHAPLGAVPRGGDLSVVAQPDDHIRTESQYGNQVPTALCVRDMPARSSPPTASLPMRGASQDCLLRRDGIARRAYLQQSAAVVHDFLVRRSSNERVD